MDLSARSMLGSLAVLTGAGVLLIVLSTAGGPISAALVASAAVPGDPKQGQHIGVGPLSLGLAVFLSCQLHAVRGAGGFRPADIVTLLRSGLLGVFAAVLADLLSRSDMPTGSGLPWLLMVLAVVILVMDGVDGAVARAGSGGTSAGARYDEVTDAVVILVLSAAAALAVGWWALALGVIRPLFALGQRIRPAWRRSLGPSRRRKVFGITPSVLLLIALCPVPSLLAEVLTVTVEMMLRVGLVGLGLLMVSVSFSLDIIDLERRTRTQA